MKHYDPNTDPDSQAWLSVDEQLRIELVEQYHRRAKTRLPNLKAHAAVHAMVENQLAQHYPPVARALERLRSQGLTRHDAIHAIGSVIMEIYFEAGQSPEIPGDGNAQGRYETAVERLTAQQWLRDYGPK